MSLLKRLWNRLLTADPLWMVTYAMAILVVGTLVVMAMQGCTAVRDTGEIVGIVKDTMNELDQDGSGSISMIEIISYVIGYDALKSGGIAGVKRIRNGNNKKKVNND